MSIKEKISLCVVNWVLLKRFTWTNEECFKSLSFIPKFLFKNDFTICGKIFYNYYFKPNKKDVKNYEELKQELAYEAILESN